MLQKNRIYLSTIDPAAGGIARKYGLGVEIADFCTAWNMDTCFPETDMQVRQQIAGIEHLTLHGPFNELFPCAIDPLARQLAAKRYRQALELTRGYGAKKLILHGGYNPRLYYRCWYQEQSVLFWREFLEQTPDDCEICLENVLEETPELLGDIVRQVNDPRLRLCLDVGHVNAYSGISVFEWIENCGEMLSHVHLHNNDGSADTHSGLDCGSLPIMDILGKIPDATVTLELPQIGGAPEWLAENGGMEL